MRTCVRPCLLLVVSFFGSIASAQTPAEVFEQRIMPIFKSPNPSSCVQCHLAGVDLKDYILPSHEKTFLSLRDQGLIDLDRPARSKILRLIAMGEEDKRGAALIHEKTRKAERAAFTAWIEACARDPKLRNAPKLDEKELAKPPAPSEVIRHERKDRLLESFERNIWAMRFRCMSCHIEGTAENDKHRKKYGDRVAWIKKAGPAATMEYILGAEGLVNSKDPEKSLLLAKPLGDEEHVGGIKFLKGDQGYKAFRAWIEDVAAIRSRKYLKAADLPGTESAVRRFGTEAWLKIADTPAEWGDKLLQVTVYAWDAEKKGWEAEPIAISDRGVWGKGRLWQHTLTLVAATGSGRAETWAKGKPALPAGRYLIKIHVDKDGRLAKDWKAVMRDEDYVGAIEVEARWPEGYGSMTVVNAGTLKR